VLLFAWPSNPADQEADTSAGALPVSSYFAEREEGFCS